MRVSLIRKKLQVLLVNASTAHSIGEKLLPSTGKPEHRDRRRPSPSGRPSGSRDGASQSRPMSGVLSYGPDIRDPAGSGTPPRVSRPRSAEVQPLQYTPSRSPALQSDGWNEHARLSMYIDDRDGRSRSSTSTPQLPTRVSDTLDAPPPHYDSLSLPADPSSSFPSTLPRSVSNPASPSEPPPLGSTLPFPTAGDNQIPSTPFFPFGIVSTDPSSIPRAGRRPLPTIPDAQGAETTNPLPRRVSQVLSDADRPSMIRRAHSDNGPSSTTASQFVDMTDLDWVVSTLEDDQTAQGVDYEVSWQAGSRLHPWEKRLIVTILTFSDSFDSGRDRGSRGCGCPPSQTRSTG